jgi:hypothetical protein
VYLQREGRGLINETAEPAAHGDALERRERIQLGGVVVEDGRGCHCGGCGGGGGGGRA